jgi:high-affinity Fe2+/Pb2+ permease
MAGEIRALHCGQNFLNERMQKKDKVSFLLFFFLFVLYPTREGTSPAGDFT